MSQVKNEDPHPYAGVGQNAGQNPGFMTVTSKRPAPKFQTILVDRFRKALRKSGNYSLLALGKRFKIADDDNSG